MMVFEFVVLAGMAIGSGPAQDPPVAFVNVAVVPMDRERVLANQTVVVRGDKIVAIGPVGEVVVPAGALRVDGTGKYLIPGLAEMHAHVPPSPRSAAETEKVLALFALNGVTTIRGMLGAPAHLTLRNRAASGEILSPTIYTSSPSLNGATMATGASAADSVAKYRAAGYDFLKIHPGIRRGVFDTIAATAKRVGIRFAGHVPLEVGIERAIELGYWSVDHLDGFMEGLVPHEGAFAAAEDGFFGTGVVMRADASRIPMLAAKARAAGVWVVPTETLMRHVVGNYTVAELSAWPEMKYWQEGLAGWSRQTAGFRGQGALAPAPAARYLDLRKQLIRGLHAAGVGFLLGSDAPQIWNVPGFSIRRELAYLVDAGLTPYQALESGTRNVAVFLGTEKIAGTIAAGMRADLVMLDGNPLVDIANVGKQAGVMIRGRWLPAAEIAKRLEALVAPPTED